MKRKLLLTLVTLCLLASSIVLPSCNNPPIDPSGANPLTPGVGLEKFTEYSFLYFDTVTTISGYAESREAFDVVAKSILAELEEYHRLYTIYHRFEGMENLCTINALKDGQHRVVEVDQRIIDLLLYAKEMYTLTGGRMNVAMGSVLSIWHDYRSDGMDDPAAAELPPMDKLLAAAEHTDLNALVIDEAARTVTITDPKMRLDVGALAKGYAVERVAQSMEASGISGYILNVGGNVRAVGKKPDGSGWTVGLENPIDTGGDYLAYLSLTKEALVTSGSYQRYYVVDGKRYHHIIHPDTLMPAEGFASVSVITPHSGNGDALSTALFCMSLEEGMALVASLPGVEAHWVLADGTRYASDGWSTYTTTL